MEQQATARLIVRQACYTISRSLTAIREQQRASLVQLPKLAPLTWPTFHRSKGSARATQHLTKRPRLTLSCLISQIQSPRCSHPNTIVTCHRRTASHSSTKLVEHLLSHKGSTTTLSARDITLLRSQTTIITRLCSPIDYYRKKQHQVSSYYSTIE